MILKMLQKLCQHMGVNVDSSTQDVQSFSKTTKVHELASELKRQTAKGLKTARFGGGVLSWSSYFAPTPAGPGRRRASKISIWEPCKAAEWIAA